MLGACGSTRQCQGANQPFAIHARDAHARPHGWTWFGLPADNACNAVLASKWHARLPGLPGMAVPPFVTLLIVQSVALNFVELVPRNVCRPLQIGTTPIECP